MRVENLGWRTHLIFPRFDGIVIDRGSYSVVRTVSNPLYYWGNFLLFDNPPTEHDLPHWLALFDREIAQVQPASQHVALGWQGAPRSDIEQIAAQHDLEYFRGAVLSCSTDVLPQTKANFTVRPLATDDEWAQALDNQLTANTFGYDPAGFREFKVRELKRFRAMQRAGLGAWFGVFDGDRLIADCGLFRNGELARFQQVVTHPDHRRRGACRSLVSGAMRYSRSHWATQQLVIVADPDDIAITIYRGLGFTECESQHELQRKAPHDRAAP